MELESSTKESDNLWNRINQTLLKTGLKQFPQQVK